jgi:hypothetical protein
MRLTLADGSQFAALSLAAGEYEWNVVRAGGRALRISAAAVRGVRASAPSDAARDRIQKVDAERAPLEKDVAIVSRGSDTVELRGTVRGYTREHVQFEWNGKEVKIPWLRLAALYLRGAAPEPAGCVARLVGGDRMCGAIAGGDAGGLELQSDSLGRVRLTWSEIERVECRSDRWILLSELDPIRYDFDGFFGKPWEFAIDATLSGEPIRLGGRTYASGITMHSRALLTYRLGERFQQLAGVTGIVDEVGDHGDVTLRVLGDGRELWSAVNVRGGQPPRQLAIDIRGVDELTLVVDRGEDLDVADHAAWAFVRLIR